ncbi:MAG: DUF4845 domain-containing protein [Betaproteobacteria bacterium]|nr:MAG: DUF4845 domain-containing protein [Betaproteobacteria bacterium]
MKSQRGISLSGLLIICVILVAVAITGFKLFPAYAEYLKVKNAVTEISRNPEGQGSPGEVRAAFDRRAAIDSISAVGGKDLEITKQGAGVVISANWSVKVPLFYNVSACMDFEARSQ